MNSRKETRKASMIWTMRSHCTSTPSSTTGSSSGEWRGLGWKN
ncbi:hypothetical protein I314_00997 [Cryptococcus bacillisporus CA1873]|uniref:Uncharacterized protein n=1 Tax=Cryptococcus bacillisporus CA1873 TaxID=1296111 RepID=A0ABR5BHC1_CRYGA|nr:hypothetical protein I314_00997 [Cryptococcus bacillisporus CA1873]KIR89333.1 hypothetical protein I308_00338 [Cryptococcus tetragattii IND107]|eukprot:KIR68576.1 hypothetical protein I314_00997 [Cryptococcus gattii CA1873]